MPALETVGQYLQESRRLLQDQVVPYRYEDGDLIDALNIAILEAKRLRADLFLPLFDLQWFNPEESPPDLAQVVTIDPMYRPALVYYVVGRMQLRDDEPTVDARAGAFLQKFTSQLMAVV